MLASMAERHPSERVNSLFGHLDEIERKLADNQQAFLRALDDKYSATALGALQEESQALAKVASTIVREIEDYVASSSAHAVFGSRHRHGEGDSSSGRSGVGALSAMEALSRVHQQRAKDSQTPGGADTDAPL